MTVLNYLNERMRLEMPVKVVDIWKDSADHPSGIITDISPFYVQGGGQPSDIGCFVMGDSSLNVTGMRKHDDLLVHEIDGPMDAITIGDTVVAKVDRQRRIHHSRIHSAGELICAAAKMVVPRWEVTSAIHFLDNSSVTFRPSGIFDLSGLDTDIEGAVNQLIVADYPVVVINNVDRDLAEQMVGYSLAGIPANVPIRLVNPCPDFYRACMGTHVESTSEIGSIQVRKLKLRKGLVTISYAVEYNFAVEKAAA